MNLPQRFLKFTQALLDVAKDLRHFGCDRHRLVDELKTLTAVWMAILLGHLSGVQHVGWAAFSGYIVMKADVGESFTRGCMRVLGTCIGGIGAVLALSYVPLESIKQTLPLAMVGFVTLYMTMVGRYSYAWLLAGLTYAMIILAGLQTPTQVERFASSRLLEVGLGTLACVVVSVVFSYSIGARWLSKARAPIVPEQRALRFWQPLALRHALQGAFALAILSLCAGWNFDLDISQAAITILAVMVVPLDGLSEASKAVSKRLMHRMAGCLLGGGFAAVLLLFSQGSQVMTLILVAVGVLIGRHIENSSLDMKYLGMQFSLAFLVVMVPDQYDYIDPIVGLKRLGGILLGFFVLELVKFFSNLLVHYPSTRFD